MDRYLYFIPLITQALNARNPDRALLDAFASIEWLGRQPEYEQGFEQFCRFMTIFHEQTMEATDNEGTPTLVDSLLVELAAGVLEGYQEKDAALALVNSRPEWRRRYEDLCAAFELMDDTSARIEVVLERPDGVLQVFLFEPPGGVASMDGIDPGDYAIRLSTGRVLWRGVLQEQDVYWTEAYPGEPLALAADTADAALAGPTRQMKLLDGEVVLRVFAGMEHGRMEIQLQTPRGAEP